MKNFKIREALPHLLAVLVFFLVTVFFFSPLFFDNKSLDQHDITEYLGTSKAIVDYRKEVGEEALWAGQVFSGMPAYLISVDWSDGPITYIKKIGALGLPHPTANIYWAFLSFYILLLAFGVRPYLAVAGALAFGLSSFVIIGLGAGHNGRIGAMAFMPLVIAGIHLSFSRKHLLGVALTAMALALHLRENHLQMTYYLVILVLVYGLVQLIDAWKQSRLKPFFMNVLALLVAAVAAGGTFFGQIWAITEYSKYSIRGKSDLINQSSVAEQSGLSKSYAFEYSNGILEPMTLMVPNFLGGSTFESLLSSEKTETYKALTTNADQQMANELARYTVAYWGDQPNTAPYYAGAVMVFLFFTGIFFVDRKWLWWLLPLSVISILMSWGNNFSTFNYFLFDYLPGYNKFRSVTFALVFILMAIPMIGMLGLEKILSEGFNSLTRRKILYGFGLTGGICLLLLITGGIGDFLRPGDEQLPVWLINAMKQDRINLVRADATRSLLFIVAIFSLIYFNLIKFISPQIVFSAIIILVLADLWSFDRRYFGKDKYRRVAEDAVAITAADEAIRSDPDYYRVYNLQGPLNEARTSYFHHSLGGYHGAKLRRYQELFDSVIYIETNRLISDAQSGNLNFADYGGLNMLNAKYITYGPEINNVIRNDQANGAAWVVNELRPTGSANEELEDLKVIDTKKIALVDVSKFPMNGWKGTADSLSSVLIKSRSPRELIYEADLRQKAPVVFSEIFYPVGWSAWIDNQPAEIFRVNYVLRALWVPEGRHTIRFRFDPPAYLTGDKITMVFNWLVLAGMALAVVFTMRRPADAVHKK